MNFIDKICSRSNNKSNIFRPKPKLSYSQCGEDVIIDFIFENHGITKINYIDIGAYDPIVYSNTYYFYCKGSHGICIEPNPASFIRIKEVRKRDICLQAGIGTQEVQDADFYIMDADTLNTFSLEAVREYETMNQVLKETIRVPLLNVNDVINKYTDKKVNFINLDTEGMDYDILKSFDFQNCRPNVFCVETIKLGNAKKIHPIFELLAHHNYISYADTYINTIFIDRKF